MCTAPIADGAPSPPGGRCQIAQTQGRFRSFRWFNGSREVIRLTVMMYKSSILRRCATARTC